MPWLIRGLGLRTESKPVARWHGGLFGSRVGGVSSLREAHNEIYARRRRGAVSAFPARGRDDGGGGIGARLPSGALGTTASQASHAEQMTTPPGVWHLDSRAAADAEQPGGAGDRHRSLTAAHSQRTPSA